MISSPYVIILTTEDRAELQARATSARRPHRDVLRARIVLAAAAGYRNAAIADVVGVHVDTARKWRRRFWQRGLKGLDDLPRPGRPRRFTPVQVAHVKALACTQPEDLGVPLARWSASELARQAVADGAADSISPATVARILARDVIKPWQHRSWIYPRDPDFAAKAGRVLDLYDRCWDGHTLADDEYVISADEKSQALQRRHPGQPTAPGRPRRVEFEYRRGGTLASFAAYDVHRAEVIGTIAPKTGIAPFADLVAAVMSRPLGNIGTASSGRGIVRSLRCEQADGYFQTS